MFKEIENMIKSRKLTIKDCDYHTLRNLENNGKIRALVLKGEKIVHIELICPNCGKYSYYTQEWKSVSKAAKYRFKTKCPKCGFLIKIAKLRKE